MNPRFKTFMDQHNIQDASAVKNHHYTGWIQEKWNKWSALTGRKRPFTPQDHVDFDKWLMNNGTEQINLF